MTAVRSLAAFLKGVFVTYCLLTFTTLLIITYAVFVVPLMFISKKHERRMLEFIQSQWVYVFLAVSAFAADTGMVLTLPEECGEEMEARVFQKLSPYYAFGEEVAARLGGTAPPATDRNRDIVIANHQIYVDWIYIWAVLEKMGRAGSVKIILKRRLLGVPIFGLGMRLLNFIFLHRKWEVDRLKFGRRIRRLLHKDIPLSLVMFPEGTTLNPDARVKSEKFSETHGLEKPRHTMVPRTTGMHFALQILGEHIDGVFDLTIGYQGTTPREYPEQTFRATWFFFQAFAPPITHIHLRYYPIATIPYQDPAAFEQWLYRLYAEKDRLMAEFYRDGEFRGPKSQRIPIASASIFWAITVTIIATAILTLLALRLTALFYGR